VKRIHLKKTTFSLVFGMIATVLIVSFNNCERIGTVPQGDGIPSQKGVETGNPMSGAILPKIYINSDYPLLPPAHRVLTVGTSGRNFTDCQSAVNAAAPGDEVVIDARFVCGRLVLPDKGNTEYYIVIRTANLAALPAEGTRISKKDAANLAVIETRDDGYAVGIADISSTSSATSGANHYYLLGLEIRVNPGVNVINSNIVKLRNAGKKLEQLPHDIVIARSWIHGNPNQEVRRGIDLNGLRMSLIDSIVEDIHRHGQSSQGIASWDASVGPYKITNNEFAVAGAALLIGWESSIPNLICSDIEVRKNLIHKLDAWRQPVTSNTGATGYWVFNESIILRSVQRILLDGNTFMNDFARIPASSNYIGRAFYFSPSGFGQSWARVQDVTVTNNIMHDIPGGFFIRYRDESLPEVVTQRIHIENNVAYNLDPTGERGFIWLEGQAAGSVVFNHNTFLSKPNSPPIAIMADKYGSYGQFAFTNNIINDQGAGVLGWGLAGNGAQALNALFPSVVFDHNALAGQLPVNYAGYNANNAFPADLGAIGFTVDVSAGIFDFHALQLKASSPYANAASDGANMGANIQRVSDAVK
jgi:hypothetical protein